MNSYDTQQILTQIAINQLYILYDAAVSRDKQFYSDNCINKKSKILLVEGKSDISFWKRILSQPVIINDVKAYADSVCALINHPPNNKMTVIELCRAVNTSQETYSLTQNISNSWIVNGVIDRDFDGQTYDAEKCLHVTDTHDLETLLIYSDPEILQRLQIAKSYGIIITKEQIATAKRLSLQMGWVRNACKKLSREEKKWLYLPKNQQNSNGQKAKIEYSVLIEKGNFDILQYLRTINFYQEEKFRKNDEELKTIRSHLISTSILENRIASDGKWLKYIDSPDDKELETWKTINGHDYLCFLKSLVPGAEKAYRSDYQSDNALEFDLIRSYDKKRFKITKLYQSMCQSKFIEPT